MSSYISPNAPHNLIWQVVWDGASDSDSEDGVEVEMPNEYQFVPETVPSDDVADYLSDKFGWCVSELYLCGCGLSKWVLDVAAVSRLKEENNKLTEQNKKGKEAIDALLVGQETLREENKKLKEEIKKLTETPKRKAKQPLETNKATDPLLEKLAENVANQRFTKEIKKLEEQYSKAVQDINQRDLERTSHLKEIKELKDQHGS